ncbi:uncharacterized protein LOC135924175 [Gordionus sp. m RMFG-2023]|uniref:uncharacterized protein LOC135924175 n=1 Tax=Gordionus sp. m RMFG-2023 TaxID=3053472 RepID=UPI0031FD91E4
MSPSTHIPIRKKCPNCGLHTLINKNGTLRKHGKSGNWCHLSHQSPLTDPIPPPFSLLHLTLTSPSHIPALTTINNLSVNEDSPCTSNELPIPSFSDEFTNLPKSHIISRIPRGARLLAAKSYSKTINNLLTNFNSPQHWKEFLLFGFHAFQVPTDKRKLSLTQQIKNRLNDLDNISMDITSTPKLSINPFKIKVNLVGKKIDNLDIKGALRLASSSDTLAPINFQTYTRLAMKHPTHQPSSTEFPGLNPTSYPIEFTPEEVRKAISTFQKDTAHGFEGMRPIYLQDLTIPLLNSQTTLLNSITLLCNRILHGDVPIFAQPIMFGAKLIALTKPNKDLRPIAIGTLFRRLVSKLISARINEKVSTILTSTQLGVDVKGGCESAAHITRIFLQNNPQNKHLIKIDFYNAYNTIKRSVFLKSFINSFPCYSSYILSCYANPSILQYGEYRLSSSEGIQQNDPLGCLLDLHIWYIDEGIISGSPEEDKALEILQKDGPDIGLLLNVDKTEFCQLTSQSPNCHAFKEVMAEELTHLGSPVGGCLAVEAFFQATSNNLNNMEGLLMQLPTHKSFFLIKNFFNIPKILYALRSTAVFKHPKPLRAYESIIKNIMEKITNLKFNSNSWHQPLSSAIKEA